MTRTVLLLSSIKFVRVPTIFGTYNIMRIIFLSAVFLIVQKLEQLKQIREESDANKGKCVVDSVDG